MSAGPPVVPGDGRVACQHCPARVEFSGEGPTAAWMDPDAASPDRVLWCTPATSVRVAIWHKPMPTVRLVP